MEEKKDNRQLAEETREKILEELVTTTPGSEKASRLLDDLDSITKVIEEMDRKEAEAEKLSHDDENKKKERRQGLWLGLAGIMVQIGGIVIGVLAKKDDNRLAERLADKSIEFEKTGNWTSSTGKSVGETFKGVFRRK